MLAYNKSFYLFFFLLICDRFITLFYFGYNYTDLDQVLMWSGAWDYSNGIFHEPFFYGQAYNYMLESLLAVPLIWLNIPPHIALPTITSLISIVPFITLAYFLKSKNEYFWSLITLALPVFLPIEYNFLTTISRGFIQAHLFIPLLFFPLFFPKKNKSITILFIASGISLIMNTSSILIILPIVILTFYNNYSTPSFYFKSLLIVPFFILDYFAKQFYNIHTERNTHKLLGLELDYKTFEVSILNCLDHFNYLLPFFSSLGSIYFILIIILIVYAKFKSLNKLLIFNTVILLLLLITLSIPKVQSLYPGASIFFSRSRLYLTMPLILLLNLSFFSFLHKKIHSYILLFILVITFIYKNITIQESINTVISDTSFPVIKISDLNQQANDLKKLIEQNKIDIVINSNKSDWKYMFDSYNLHSDMLTNNYTSLMIKGDRRTWLYQKDKTYNTILLNGFQISDTLLKQLDYELINGHQILIKNSSRSISITLKKLELEFGI